MSIQIPSIYIMLLWCRFMLCFDLMNTFLLVFLLLVFIHFLFLYCDSSYLVMVVAKKISCMLSWFSMCFMFSMWYMWIIIIFVVNFDFKWFENKHFLLQLKISWKTCIENSHVSYLIVTIFLSYKVWLYLLILLLLF
jgi:hypothetical protein